MQTVLNEKIVIWGTRELGNLAYFYYKDKAEIVCYIDNDKEKWGKTLNGIKICPPDVLDGQEIVVILALRNGIDAIEKQLHEIFGIKSYVLFQMEEKLCTMGSGNVREEILEDTCVVSFSGGLGNQMFQYAFFKNLQVRGKRVLADLMSYNGIGVMSFQLLKVFPNICLEVCTQEQKKKLLEKNTSGGKKEKNFVIYKRTASSLSERRKRTDLFLLDITGGIISGTHLSCRFPEMIRDELVEDFRFEERQEDKLKILADKIKKENAVSVHIRRGDYTLKQNEPYFGNICTKKYYISAMKYIEGKVDNCRFHVFSDGIEEIKGLFQTKDVVYIEKSMFDRYEDWYDMYLMSLCKHNIIANSTFSWWGAWLNQYAHKIVVAPQKWINSCDFEDIYPREWVQIS